MKISVTAIIWYALSCSTAIKRNASGYALLLVLPWSPTLAADLRASVVDGFATPVADAVVIAVPENGAVIEAKQDMATVDQIDQQFVPYVKAIAVGTSVSFPNKDDIRHHVYSFSKAKRFELPLYSGVPADPVTFEIPGVVTLGCNIHDWMVGYIYVSESPWFAVTDAEGAAVIKGLPEGKYRVRTWHPLLKVSEESTEQSVDIETTLPAELHWVLSLKPDIRPRRAPIGGMKVYH